MIAFQPSSRRYRNAAEFAFVEAAKIHGWAVSKRGWPDFLCFKDGELIVVEVKPDVKTRRKRLDVEQQMVLAWLASHGVKCYVWSPQRGFERVKAP